MTPTVTLLVPVFNEADIVASTAARLVEVLEGVDGTTFEVVFVDDGSGDATVEVLEGVAAGDDRVRVVSLSRNFGKEGAMAAGLSEARGAAVILIDGDLQHPPELIPEMLDHWRQGAHVVEAVKVHRGTESWLYKAFATAFHRMMRAAIGRETVGDSDYKLLDRQVVDLLNLLPERQRYFRGLVAWAGYRTVRIPMVVQDRAGGTTKWTLFGLVKYSLRNLVAFTELPLQIVAGVGAVSATLSVILAAQTLVVWLVGSAVDGFTTTIVAVSIFSGIILGCQGVISLYLAQLYREVKGRPTFIVQHPRQVHAPHAAEGRAHESGGVG